MFSRYIDFSLRASLLGGRGVQQAEHLSRENRQKVEHFVIETKFVVYNYLTADAFSATFNLKSPFAFNGYFRGLLQHMLMKLSFH